MASAYEQVCKHVLEKLQAEFSERLVGLISCGSQVSGDLGASSDFDFVCVISGKRRKTRFFEYEGRRVEIWIRPLATIREAFLDTNIPDLLHMFGHSKLLLDRDGVIKELCELARRIIDSGRPALPLNFPFKQRYSYIAFDLLDDAKDLLHKDPASASYVMSLALEASLDLHFRIKGEWYKKPKTRLAELSKFDPGLALTVRTFLTQSDLTQKHNTLISIVDQCCKPLGGRLSEWETPWEFRTLQGTWEVAESTTTQEDSEEGDA